MESDPYRRLHWSVIVIPFAPGLLMFLVAPLFSSAVPGLMESAMGPFAVYVGILACVAVGIHRLLHRLDGSWSELGFENFRWRSLAWALVLTGVGFAVFAVSQLFARALDLPPIRNRDYELNSLLDLGVAVVACSIVGPLAEEIIYRSFLIRFLNARLRSRALVLALPVLIFTSVHILPFGLSGSLFILFWTPLIVLLFVRSQSIYPGFLMHAVNNFFAYVLVPAGVLG